MSTTEMLFDRLFDIERRLEALENAVERLNVRVVPKIRPDEIREFLEEED